MDVEQDVEQYIEKLAQKYGSELGSFPEPPSKDTLLKFMREVLGEQDPERLARASNLTDEEVGRAKIPSLVYLHLAGYAESEGYGNVAEYLRAKTGALSTLSLGRRAKLLETLFTVRRETRQLVPPKITKKNTLFGSTTTKEGEA